MLCLLFLLKDSHLFLKITIFADNTEDIDPNDPMYRGANRGGRKRGTSTKAPISRAPAIKRQRRTSDIIPPPVPTPAPPPPMEIEKPDANMCLKVSSVLV